MPVMNTSSTPGARTMTVGFVGLGRRVAVEVERDHPRALARIADRNRPPDPGARAGDDRDMVGEKGHGGVPLVLFLQRQRG